MPQPIKQQPLSKPPAPPVKATSSQEELMPGLKVAEYGRGKTGKTRFACTFPKPALLIGTEDGTSSVRDYGSAGRRKKTELVTPYGEKLVLYQLILKGKPSGVDFVMLRTNAVVTNPATGESQEINVEANSDALLFLCDYIKKQNYKSSILDHAGRYQDTILKELAGLEKVPEQKSWGITDQQGWGIVAARFKDKIGTFLDLADRYGKNIVVIAHERNFTEGGKADVMFPSVGAALTPSISGWLATAVDYLCQTYIREQVTTTSSAGEDGGIVVPVAVKTGKKEFCLRVGPHETFMTGFRTAFDDIPDSIVNPTYEKVIKLISTGKV